MTEYRPKAGDKCLLGDHPEPHTVQLAVPDNDGFIVLSIDGEYCLVDISNVKPLHPVAEDYRPKVGDKVEYPSGEGILIVDEPDNNDIVIVRDVQGEYRRVSVFAIKPLQAEEEQLIESMCNVFEKTACKQVYSMKDGMKALIDAGYRKTKPISFDMFVNYYGNNNANLGDMFSDLKKHGFITVKGE